MLSVRVSSPRGRGRDTSTLMSFWQSIVGWTAGRQRRRACRRRVTRLVGCSWTILALACGGKTTGILEGGGLAGDSGVLSSGGTGGYGTGGQTGGSGSRFAEKTGGTGGTDGAGGEDACSGDECPCPFGFFDHDSDPSTACEQWSECEPGQYVSAEGTPDTDRQCGLCSVGTFTDDWNEDSCQEWSDCSPGSFVDDAGAFFHDVVCRLCTPGTYSEIENASSCTTCPEGTFADESGSSSCTPWGECAPGERKQDGSATQDVTCTEDGRFRQLGTAEGDSAYGIATDSQGHIYVAGATEGAFEGTSAGEWDAFLIEMSEMGSLLGVTQFGTEAYDSARAVAVGPDDEVYLVGITYGDLAVPNAGLGDAFIRKYDASGTLLWTQQYGTGGLDRANSVDVGPQGAVYVVGGLDGDAYLRKYTSEGELEHEVRFGTDGSDLCSSVGVFPGGDHVYVAGETNGVLQGSHAGGTDVFVRDYSVRDDSSLEVAWTRQFGTTEDDYWPSVGVYAGGVTVFGHTYGVVGEAHAGGADIFVRRFLPWGTEEWTRQLGTSYSENGSGIVDADGNSYVVGQTSGSLEGPNVGELDGFLRKYDPEGDVLWQWQFGTATNDLLSGAALDLNGRLYVTGETSGTFEGAQNVGGDDLFVMEMMEP